ncbi:transcription factor E2F6-like [Xiphophorus maculatus]|uniref:transcription factor E2F6-like n=1 Tax=Xiphophorus maculatus TaxID=8083 RepID=UPI000293BF9D|nr:transcription factor E2F6-like [Xiphophorus maculatus]
MLSTPTEERKYFCSPEANSRLELQGSVPREPQDEGGIMASIAGANQTKMGIASQTHNIKKEAMLLFQKTRADNSLVLLTRKFAQRLNHCLGGVVDLNLVSSELKVSKRRLYDITNVLEGINLMKKTHKNHHQWLGGPVEDSLARSLEALIEEEEKLDELIQICARQISRLCEENLHDRYAYLTYEDIRSISSFEQQTVIVIKAPPETRLQVPHPEESLQIHLRSTNRPIDVFLCSDTPVAMETAPAGSASGGQAQLPACVKYSSAPPSFSMQTSTEEDHNSSCETKGFSNPESEVTPHSTLLSFIPLTNSCCIPPKLEHSYAISSPISSLGEERCLISLTTDEDITKFSSA